MLAPRHRCRNCPSGPAQAECLPRNSIHRSDTSRAASFRLRTGGGDSGVSPGASARLRSSIPATAPAHHCSPLPSCKLTQPSARAGTSSLAGKRPSGELPSRSHFADRTDHCGRQLPRFSPPSPQDSWFCLFRPPGGFAAEHRRRHRYVCGLVFAPPTLRLPARDPGSAGFLREGTRYASRVQGTDNASQTSTTQLAYRELPLNSSPAALEIINQQGGRIQ